MRYLFPRQTPPEWVPLGGGKKDKPPARLVCRSCRNPCRGPLGKAAHCGQAFLSFPKNFAAMLARTTERRHFFITSSHAKPRPNGCRLVVGRGRSCRNPCRGPLGKAAHCGQAFLSFPKNFAAMLARTTERRHFFITSSHAKAAPEWVPLGGGKR